jgi:hypothetical protein
LGDIFANFRQILCISGTLGNRIRRKNERTKKILQNDLDGQKPIVEEELFESIRFLFFDDSLHTKPSNKSKQLIQGIVSQLNIVIGL